VTTDTYSYYAFGEVRTSSGSTANPFKFVGRLGYYDDPSTEFQYLRARYYAAPYGRFWSGERQRGGGPGYGYTGGNPNAFVDPSGQWKICLPHPTSVHEERNVHPTTDWSTWECHDADCDYSVLEHPVETIVCTWKKSRSIEGEERWCRWWRCWEKVRGKKCRTWFEYRCSPWEAFKGTENKYDTTYIEIGSCRTMDRKEMKKECTTHTWPGG
jgi:RHS repeat-associated protein